MQSPLLLLPLLVLGARAQTCYTEIYSDEGQTGNYVHLEVAGVANLSTYGMDDDIESVNQTGIWLYSENFYHNIYEPGIVYYVHGIDIAVTFPEEYQNIMTSLRHTGCYSTPNDAALTFFEGTAFAGWMYNTVRDATIPEGDGVSGNVSSIIMIGSTSWTVYTGTNYTGSSWCLDSTDHDVGSDGSTLDVGIFPNVEDIGIPDNSIWSVRKGCYAARVAKAPKLQVDGRQQNGAWGRLV